MGKKLNFLYLEDSELDVQILTSALEKEGITFRLDHARNRESFTRFLEENTYDIIFSDYALPSFDGISALEMARNICPATPFIIVSGNIGEELAIETLKRGATDYVLKSHFSRLVPSIQRALEEKTVKEQRRSAEEAKSRYDFIVNSSRSFMSLVNRDYVYEAINNSFCSAHNLVRDEIIGKKLSEIWGEENFRKVIKKSLDQSFSNKEIHYQAWFETPRDGLRCFEVSFYPYRNDLGDITHTVVDTVDITDKKRAEQALRENEEKYRTLVERARDGIVILVGGKVAFVNRHLLELSGYTLTEVMGSPFTHFLHPAFQQRISELYKRRKEDEDLPSIYDTVLRKKDGSDIQMEVNVGLIRFGGERAEMIMLRDITDRKNTEEALRTSEAKFKSFVEQTPEGIVIVDEAGNTVEWNTGMEIITGVGRNEVIDRPFWEVEKEILKTWGSDMNADKLRKQIENALKTGKADWLYDIVEYPTEIDGLTMHIQSSVFPIKTDLGFMLGGVFRNNTRMKLAELELRDNRDFFRTLNDYIGDGVMATTFPDRKITFTNKACIRVFGYREKELIGKNTGFLWYEEEEYRDFGRFLNENWKKGKSVLTYEARLKRKNGEGFYSELTVSLLSSNGKPDRVITVIRDITERKNNQEKIRQQTEDISLINELHSAVNKGKTLKQVLKLLSAATGKLYKGYGASVYLLSEDRKFLVPYLTGFYAELPVPFLGKEAKEPGNIKIPATPENIFGRILAKGLPRHVSRSAEVEELISQFLPGGKKNNSRTIIKSLGIQAILTIPLKVGKTTLGLMEISRDHVFSGDETERLINLSTQVSSIISRKMNDERMLESESMYRTLFETANDAIFILKNGRVVECNQQTINIFGYQREEFVGMEPSGFSPSEQPDRTHSDTSSYARMDDALKKGPQYFEWMHRRANGVNFYAEVSLNKIQIKGESYLQAIVRDISERKKAEEEQARLITAIEQSAETVVITDREGAIQYVNPAFEDVTGYNRDEVIGHNPRILKSGKQDAEFYSALWETISGGRVWNGKFINRRKDGTFYEEFATISPVRDEQGNVVNYVAVKRDITRESQLESQLRQIQKMETIGTLAGGIAHDFNNILATIMGYTDMALKEIPSDSEHYRDFIQVMKASNRGKELVKKILTFSRQMEQRYEPVHFDTVVRESIDLIKPSLEAGVVINADIEQRCDAVMGDPTQLQQVVMNLLTNAAYAMQKTGGTIGIELKCILSGDPEMVYTPQLLGEKYLMLKVSDTGTGMKEEVASRIFEPFFTTKPVGEGTGLGLAVTHGIVKNMDGEIHVESEEGKGSVFRVYFPVQDSERKAGDPAAGKPGSGSERILVVDDEKEFLEMVRKMLEKLGYTVDIQENPLMVPDILQEGSSEYDLIIIDHVMPKYTGMQLAEKIQKLKPGIPMILITGYAETFPAEKIRKMGFREYLYKPVTSKELNNAIRMALRKTAKKRT